MTVAHGLGVRGGLLSYGIVGSHLYRLVRLIEEELWLPLEESRVAIIEIVANELQKAIIEGGVRKTELHETVRSYQGPIDDLTNTVDSLEKRILNIRKARAAGRWPAH